MPSQFSQRQNQILKMFQAGETCDYFIPGQRGMLKPSGKKLNYATIEALMRHRKIIKLGPRHHEYWAISKPGDWEKRDAEEETRKEKMRLEREQQNNLVRADRHERWSAAILNRLSFHIVRSPDPANRLDNGEIYLVPSGDLFDVLDAIAYEAVVDGGALHPDRIPQLLRKNNIPAVSWGVKIVKPESLTDPAG